MSKTEKIILLLIILLGSFFILFRLGRHDMLGDDAHYAFRSIGYFDFLASEEQTTPVQWFGQRPGWSLLSMHDHPPLAFLVQHIFFKLFWVSVTVARLPSALAAIGSLVVVYFLGKRFGGIKTGLFATGALALNNYFVWTGRLSLLESIFTFFLLLGLLYLVKGLREERRYLVLSGFYLGLSFLSKYTFLFVLPAILVYLVWQERWVFRDRKFWLGVVLFLLVTSPVIIYNLGMLKTRGHFDVQFADLFGQQHNDWPKLGRRVSLPSFDPLTLITNLVDGFSWPYFLVFISSLVGTIVFARKTKAPLLYLSSLIFLFLGVFFSTVGAAARWLGVFAPIAALIVGTVLSWLAEVVTRRRQVKYLALGLLSVLILWAGFYILNSNTLRSPAGSKKWYADMRIENYGYNQLDKRISNLLQNASPPPYTQAAVTAWWYSDFYEAATRFTSLKQRNYNTFNFVVIYDSHTEWFPTLWTFERWKLYHRFLMPTAEEYLKLVQSEDSLKLLQKVNPDGIYLIQAASQVAVRSNIKFPEMDIMVENFKNQGISPEVIYDDKDREAFYVYRGSLK